MPEEFFKTLTFGELTVGQKFICLPSPGDNQGHGGLRAAHYLFIKTDMHVTDAAPGLRYGIPTGRAINVTRGVPSDFPDSMPVILVE